MEEDEEHSYDIFDEIPPDVKARQSRTTGRMKSAGKVFLVSSRAAELFPHQLILARFYLYSLKEQAKTNGVFKQWRSSSIEEAHVGEAEAKIPGEENQSVQLRTHPFFSSIPYSGRKKRRSPLISCAKSAYSS